MTDHTHETGDMFDEHPDLNGDNHKQCITDTELLTSLVREFHTEAEEAMTAKAVAMKFSVAEEIITDCALTALAKTRAEYLAEALFNCSRGRLRFSDDDLGVMAAAYGEAFVVGTKYAAEKHEWFGRAKAPEATAD